MTQTEVDILCVNTQSELGLQGSVLVKMIRTGDLSAPAMAANHMALNGLMRAIKDYDVTSEVLSDDELFGIQEKIISLVNSSSTYR